jgi:glycerol kinase
MSQEPSSKDLVLAIDQGTTGSTAVLFKNTSPQSSTGPRLVPIASMNCEFAQIYPRSGWVEHDPEAIWTSVLRALDAVLNQAEQRGYDNAAQRIAALGLTNQRETVLALEQETLRPLSNAIVWQDRRTAERCTSIRQNPQLNSAIRNKTGLVVDPYFSATKMEWLLQNNALVNQAITAGRALFVTIDAFLLARLTGGESLATEPTNASRTMLVSLDQGAYDEFLLKTFGIPKAALAPIQDSIGTFGQTHGLARLPDGIPITAVLGDQQAALFGQNAHQPGEAKLTFGTGSFVLMNTGSHRVSSDVEAGLLTSIALQRHGQLTYCLEGACFIAGAAIQFLRDQLHFFSSSSESEPLALSEAADPEVEFVPSLAGLSAPFWNPKARGVLFGLSRGTSQAHITRAVLESLALQHVPLIDAMERSSGLALKWLGVDGGAARNTYLVQYQADVLQRPLRRPTHLEATAAGAALAAWFGLYPDAELSRPAQDVEIIQPTRDEAWAKQRFERWIKAAAAVQAYYS